LLKNRVFIVEILPGTGVSISCVDSNLGHLTKNGKS
jgi:hypothetical protein